MAKEIKSKDTYYERFPCSMSCGNITDWREATPIPIELTPLKFLLGKQLPGRFLYLCPKCIGMWPVKYNHSVNVVNLGRSPRHDRRRTHA